MTCILCGSDGYKVVLEKGRDWEHGTPGTVKFVKCAECAFIYMTPAPTVKELKSFYPEDYHAYHLHKSSLARLLKDRYFKMRAQQIKDLIGRMDLFVGTRMHSSVYALAMRVPALAIAYQPKTRGTMQQLGLDDFVVPIEDVSTVRFQEKFEQLSRRREEIRDLLSARIPEIQRLVCRNSEYIAEDLRSIPRL